MFLDYIILSIILIFIGLMITLVFSKILHVRVFGGSIVMIIVATSGALLGMYYFPIINALMFNKINLADSMMGAIILIVLLHIATPKSLK